MQFTDFTFLLVFLPMALILFFVVEDKVKPYILLCSSLFFYALCQPDFFFGLCILTAINTGIVIYIGKSDNKRTRLFFFLIGISVNITILAFYKYSDNTLLPLGLSFYCFKAISVLVDSYTGKAIINQPVDVANYLSFFGQIQSGPIARYEVNSACKLGGGKNKLNCLQVALKDF